MSPTIKLRLSDTPRFLIIQNNSIRIPIKWNWFHFHHLVHSIRSLRCQRRFPFTANRKESKKNFESRMHIKNIISHLFVVSIDMAWRISPHAREPSLLLIVSSYLMCMLFINIWTLFTMVVSKFSKKFWGPPNTSLSASKSCKIFFLAALINLFSLSPSKKWSDTAGPTRIKISWMLTMTGWV